MSSNPRASLDRRDFMIAPSATGASAALAANAGQMPAGQHWYVSVTVPEGVEIYPE